MSRRVAQRGALRRAVDVALLRAFYWLCRRLPVDLASAMGGRLGRLLPLFLRRKGRLVRSNLALAFPDLDEPARRRLARGFWDNFGRTLAEYPHLHRLVPEGRVAFAGLEHLTQVVRQGGPFILLSAHLANWELGLLPVAQHGLKVGTVYRTPSNPLADRLLREIRDPLGAISLPKGPKASRGVLRMLGAGQGVAMLMDQRLSGGAMVPFFGRPAATSTALARFALRFRCPVVPIHVERLGGARFRVVVEPPIRAAADADPAAETVAFTARATALIEGWVRARPEQWLWNHRRWPDRPARQVAG